MKCPLHILDSSAFCEKYSISELPLVVFMGLTVMPSQTMCARNCKETTTAEVKIQMWPIFVRNSVRFTSHLDEGRAGQTQCH